MGTGIVRLAGELDVDAVAIARQGIERFQEVFERLREEIRSVIVGHEESVEQVLTAFFAGGHVLIEGVPGTGKTLLARTLGEALHLRFTRVQFTVDLMPADITGTRVVAERNGRREFVFVRGPIFTHILLADEINRATPKTQSALLEAMAELQVTAAGETYRLDPPFFVLATLNPIEMEGTYPLPEAQLDRFLVKVRLPYPGTRELQEIVGSTTTNAIRHARPVFDAETAASEAEELRRLVRGVLVAPHVEAYAAALVTGTIPTHSKFAPPGPRPFAPDPWIDRYVSFGASPRGGQALLLGAKVRALLAGRANVTFEDVDWMAVPALGHRLVLNFAAQAEGIDPGTLVERTLHAARKLRS
ncbi:MAG: ATPase AAA [Candidatus Binatia bacterium]|nr:MAG: ATPase AAA [Candidatus Binatia bacterium]